MFIRIILVILTSFVASNSLASYGILSDEERDSKLKIMAAENLKKSRDMYLDKYYACIQESEKQRLDNKELDNLQLTKEEFKIVILYFSAKNIRACVGKAVDDYVIATNLARYFNVDEFSLKDDPETKQSKYSADTLPINEMNYEADYLQLSSEKRDKLSKVKALNSLFNLKKAVVDFVKKN